MLTRRQFDKKYARAMKLASELNDLHRELDKEVKRLENRYERLSFPIVKPGAVEAEKEYFRLDHVIERLETRMTRRIRQI